MGEKRTRSPLPTTRVDFPKTKLNVWFRKQRNTRPKMMLTGTVSKPRMDLKTTVTLSRDQSVATKLHRKWIPPIRRPWKARLKKPLAGSTATPPPRRRNTKRSRRNSKASPCPSFRRWEVAQEVCLEVCQVVCQVVCLIWEGLRRVLL